MITIHKIQFSFGGRTLFDNASLQILPQQKSGLIGPNGCGKSTLLKILLKEYSIDSGQLNIQNNLRIGHLHQEVLSGDLSVTAFDNAFAAFEEIIEIEKNISNIESKETHQHEAADFEKLEQLHFRFEMLDGNKARPLTAKVLSGLGFSDEQMHTPMKELSGGWRMRSVLAKMLLEKNDLLLLDEPTNHLDLPTIIWMEQYMKSYDGAYIVISHDRNFLDKVCNSIIEIDNKQFAEYSGNYSSYEIQKAERLEIITAQKINQDKYFKNQEKFIERFRAKNTKATAVQSRIKKLEKIERIELEQETDRSLNIKLEFDQQPGNVVADIEIKNKSYGDLLVIQDTKLQISRGDKIALIGANGFGKSTLLKILNHQESFDGKVELGYNVLHSYYAQHQVEALNLKHNILEELQNCAPDKSDTFLRSLAGAFLFHGDDVFKKIKILSGGEKARVALSKTLLAKANFLLMDEPNNHLDIYAVRSLADTLADFKGTLLLVSHDRFFISTIANKIWYIEDKTIKEYPGTYAEFENWYSERSKTDDIHSLNLSNHSTNQKENKSNYHRQKEIKREYQKIKNEPQKIETHQKKLETSHKSILQELNREEVYTNFQKLKDLQIKEKQIQNEMKINSEKWEKTYLKLMSHEEQF